VEPYIIAAATAAWLGILTSISPCPLATNLVAISYISRDVGSPARVFWTGMLYTLGRTLTYAALGALIVGSVLSISQVSMPLQFWMNRLLGPILIVVGMFLLGLFRFNFSISVMSGSVQDRARSWGIWGAGMLGMIFALSFCPVSAALFFGSLIPLALKVDSRLALPALYGIGTGLPVALFAIALAAGVQFLSAALNRLGMIERWARRATGVVFVAVGLLYTLDQVLELL
jgi:cytochrome c-type biogenesis protein